MKTVAKLRVSFPSKNPKAVDAIDDIPTDEPCEYCQDRVTDSARDYVEIGDGAPFRYAHLDCFVAKLRG